MPWQVTTSRGLKAPVDVAVPIAAVTANVKARVTMDLVVLLILVSCR